MSRTKASVTPSMPSLAVAQINLEDSTKELRAAQKTFELAKSRLELAEEGHQVATMTLLKEVESIRSATKITPLAMR